jgi:hypothetical protein
MHLTCTSFAFGVPYLTGERRWRGERERVREREREREGVRERERDLV